MSTIDRLFDAKRRAPAVELAPTAAPPAPGPEALAGATPPEPPPAPPAVRATIDHRRDDSATVEVIGSFVAPVLLADDELIDVFGGLAGAAPVAAAPPAAAASPVPAPVSVPISPPLSSPPSSPPSPPTYAPVAPMPRRPRSRWVDIASHAMAVVLIACAGLVIAHRLGVPLPGLHRAGVAPVVPPAASALPDASVAAVDPAPAAAPDPPPVAVDLPAAAPAGAESPSPNSRRPPPRPSVAQVAPLAAAADAGAAAQATGTVLLAISPWGEVLVDGVGRGVTPPLDRIALAPGSYRFEVRNPAAPRYAATLEVRAGESITLKHRF